MHQYVRAALNLIRLGTPTSHLEPARQRWNGQRGELATVQQQYARRQKRRIRALRATLPLLWTGMILTVPPLLALAVLVWWWSVQWAILICPLALAAAGAIAGYGGTNIVRLGRIRRFLRHHRLRMQEPNGRAPTPKPEAG